MVVTIFRFSQAKIKIAELQGVVQQTDENSLEN